MLPYMKEFGASQGHAADGKSRRMAEMSFTEAVNATIKAEASAQGIGLRDLSLAAGFGKETIRNYIHRKRPMDTDRIESVAEALGMSSNEFIGLVMQRIERSRTSTNGLRDGVRKTLSRE